MSKLTIIYNTCGISGSDQHRVQEYHNALDSCLRQDCNPSVVFSSCMNNQSVIDQIQARFDNKICYNLIREVVPVNVSFNHSVKQHKKVFGDSDAYFYMASDTIFTANDQLSQLHNLMMSGNYGIVSAKPTIDSGFIEWLKFDYNALPENRDYIIPVGKACNMHTLLFSNKIYEYYGNIIPDIFAAYCSESTFSFMLAAIGLQWIICNGVVMNHFKSFDGASSGFDHKVNNVPWDNTWHCTRSMKDIIADNEGIKNGFGYEELNGVLIHDPSQFENNVCINAKLKEFIKNNIYLHKEEFDYDAVNSEFKVLT